MPRYHIDRVLRSTGAALLIGASVLLGVRPAGAQAVCSAPQVASGLQLPLSIVQSPEGNLLVSESGIRAPNTGRISIVGLNGTRRSFVAGLPSGISDAGDPSGPAGLFMLGRTLYVAIGMLKGVHSRYESNGCHFGSGDRPSRTGVGSEFVVL